MALVRAWCRRHAAPRSGSWDGGARQSGRLSNCSSPDAQFRFVGARGAALKLAGTPTVCKVPRADVACYITKGGGPCSPCPGPKALPVPAPTPPGARMSWELCAQLCYGLNATKAGVEYGNQRSPGSAQDNACFVAHVFKQPRLKQACTLNNHA